MGVAQETSSRATSLECCLQSALKLILIIPPSSPTQQPFRPRAAADKYWCEDKQQRQHSGTYMDICHTLTTGETSFLSLHLHLFCPSGFMVQPAVHDLIVPNHCWRSWLLSNTSPFLCPVLISTLFLFPSPPPPFFSNSYITFTEDTETNCPAEIFKRKRSESVIRTFVPQERIREKELSTWKHLLPRYYQHAASKKE